MILLAACQPGLERVVADELADLGLGPAEPAHPGLLRCASEQRAEEVGVALRARTADDLYLQIAGGDRGAFDRATDPLRLPGDVLAAQAAALAAAGRRPRGHIKTTCIVLAGDARRAQVEARLARRLLAARPSWRLDRERPDAEIVAFLSRRSALLALRLTDPAFRHRNYRRAPAALSPTVAAALVRLGGTTAADRLLDPCCGGGTILLERAQMGPYRELLGGDASAAALDVARANFGRRHKPWTLEVWDARQLPLTAGSVNRVVSNLPFDAQSPAPGGVRAFVAACLGEVARVVAPGGQAVLLWPADVGVSPPPGLRLREEVHFSLVGRAVAARAYERGAGV